MNLRLVLAIVLALFLKTGFSQPYSVSGRVLDAETRQPLAFVNIVINQSNVGGHSDIDGYFNLHSNDPIQTLRFSYVGYEQKILQVEDGMERALVTLERKTLELSEVIIVAGQNPAIRIIENAIRNRDRNNYERLPSFAYRSYEKNIITIDTDTLVITEALEADSSFLRLKEILDEQHFFITETVSERKFLYPGRDQQKVIATRVAGFQDPLFILLLSQIQSTSFYDDVISISDKNYVNPISRGSISRYSFTLQDTLIQSGTTDTTFIISYQPRPNTNFDGLKGILHINSNRWAIQNVIAEPARQENVGFDIRIQQMYELIDGLYWFPVQLNTDIILRNVEVNGYVPMIKGKSYITDIVVNPTLVRRMFSELSMDVDPNAAYRTDEEWDSFRVVELSEKDRRTYHVVDSIGQAENFERVALIIESIATGNIPVGKFNIPMNRLLRFNKYEKVYLGFGLKTGPRISRKFSTGAYVGYGFGDKQFKYGAELNLDLHRFRDFGGFLKLENDLTEPGKVDPFARAGLFGLNDYRSFLLSKLDHTKLVSTGFQYRLLPYLLANVGFDRSWKAPMYDYYYGEPGEEPFPKAYVFSEFSAGFRFIFREIIIQTTRSRISLGSKYPTIWFKYTRGLDGFLDGEFAYNRYDLKIEQSLYTKFIGKTTLMLQAGIIDSDVPYMQLYAGFGSYAPFMLHADQSFATMRMNEFTADLYANIFFSHNFGKLLLRTKRFRPEFEIVTNAGYGWLRNQIPEKHSIELQDFSQGYFESGLLINNLLDLRIYNLGFGAVYRYGAYSLDGFKENVAWRLTLNFPF